MTKVSKKNKNGGAAAETPLMSVQTALDQLRFLAETNPWFARCDTRHWFDVPADERARLQAAYQFHWSEVNWQTMQGRPVASEDPRFSSEHWQKNSQAQRVAAFYLLNTQFLRNVAQSLSIDDAKARQRLMFLLEQAISASSPGNFASGNPDVWAAFEETRGESLKKGLAYFMADVQEGKLRQSSRDDFTLGVDLAATEGGVVFENDLFQLIQYKPRTAKQFKNPLLVVPPAINKYYILDLGAENSMVRHLLEQGHAVFLMSWRNAGPQQAAMTWDDYLEDGVLKALETVAEISGAAKFNCMGFCIGGTLLATALAVYTARGGKAVASLSLLTTFLDFEDTGELQMFVDEEFVRFCEQHIGGKAGAPPQVLNGNILANTFSLLRPDSLWWNVWIDKYLKGEKPRSMDLLFWNNDSVNLPGPMYCWYMRHAYLQDELKSGNLVCCGQKIDFRALKMPTYLFAAKGDHIVPWKSAYANTRWLGGNMRFVLGSSGHVAGVINPPAAKKRNYWSNDKLHHSADDWLEGAEKIEGSWWPDWFAWLEKQGGGLTAAPRALGSTEHPVIEAAPGRYVKV